MRAGTNGIRSIKDEQKIKDLIVYLHTFDNAPVKLTKQRRHNRYSGSWC
ncbi:hypothetical protein [Bradyrhizobium manausense]|nr:hypothetical protein [Bradyrhizobium manausense]